MPTAMTFDSLSDDLKSYLERGYPSDTEVVAQIPRLINLAERSIANILKVLGFVTPVMSTLAANNPVYQKPDRWRRTLSMRYGVAAPGSGQQNVSIPLFGRSYEYCRMYWPDQTQVAAPEFYADYDFAHWLIVPTPVISYPWEVVYSQQPPLLDSSNQSNWLTDYAPNLLLYCTLMEATPYLKNDERIPVWKTYRDEQFAALEGQDLDRIFDRQLDRQED